MDRGFLSGIGDFNKDYNPDLLLNNLGDGGGEFLGFGKNSVSNSLYGQQGNRQYEYSRHLDNLYNTDPNTQAGVDTIAAIVAAYFGGSALAGSAGEGAGASAGAGAAGSSGAGAGSSAYGLTAGEGSATGASGGLGFQNLSGSGLGFTAGGDTLGAGSGGLGFTMSPSVASTTGYGTGSMWGSSGGFNTDLASKLLKNLNSFSGSNSGSSSGGSSGYGANAGMGGQNWMQKQAEEYRRSLMAHNLRSNKTPGYDFES